MSSRTGSFATGAGRRASTYVAIVMTATALLSALVVGAYNYWESRQLLTETVARQLADVGANRADRIERGLDELRDVAGILAVEPTISAALVDLAEAYRATDGELDEADVAYLRSLYEEGIAIATPPGVEPPTADELLPGEGTAQYLQRWYLAGTPLEERAAIDDPGDGSPYSAAHAVRHPGIRSLVETLTIDDVVLVDPDGVVVYTTDKRIDFATDLTDGPHRDSGLAEAVGLLETAAVDEVVVVDYAPYAPAGGLPTLWIATVVRTGDEVVGVLAIPVGNEVLVDLVTANRDWQALGLGETGEVYIVGPDLLLRSESRLWLEDPEAYLEAMADAGYGEETIDAVRTFGTTVLLQPVDTEPVDAAISGDQFEGTAMSYLDRRTAAYAEAIDSGSLGWIAVTEAETSEIFSPLRRYLVRLGIIALLTIPIVVVAATFLARRMVRPIDPIVDAADRVTDGDIDVEIAMGGADEFSDLAAQFDAFVAELRHQRAEVERTDAETTELLATVLPRRLVDQFRAGDRDIAESIRNATLVAVRVAAVESATVTEDEMAEYGVAIAQGVADLAQSHDAEQIASSASSAMFAMGLGSDQLDIDQAVVFATEIRRWADEFLEGGHIPLRIGVGVAAGDVVANVVGTQRLAFDVLGSPRRIAEDLASAGWGAVLVDAVIAGHLGPEWGIDRVVDPDGPAIEAWRLSARADA